MLGMQGTEMMRQLLSRRPRGINAFVAKAGGEGGADPGHHRGKVCIYQLDSILLVVLVQPSTSRSQIPSVSVLFR